MDIVERLRNFARDYTTTTHHDDLINEAADEIDRLRDEIAALKQTLAMSIARHLYDEVCAEVERMRKVFDAAENLVKVRGRHHTGLAYERLMLAVDAAMKKGQ